MPVKFQVRFATFVLAGKEYHITGIQAIFFSLQRVLTVFVLRRVVVRAVYDDAVVAYKDASLGPEPLVKHPSPRTPCSTPEQIFFLHPWQAVGNSQTLDFLKCLLKSP